MTENIVTGKKYRILTDATRDIWDRISFWTKASDVYYNDGTTAEAGKPVNVLKRNAAYSVGNIAYAPTAPSWVMLRCTTAGTTASTIPTTYSTISSVGTVITDGTAKFTVYDVRPNASLSSSAYQIPTMSLLSSFNSELTANGKQFYFDYQNGEYGFNTASNRPAASFVPFGGSHADICTYLPSTYIGNNDVLMFTKSGIAYVQGGSSSFSGQYIKAEHTTTTLKITTLVACHVKGSRIVGGTKTNIDANYSANQTVLSITNELVQITAY